MAEHDGSGDEQDRDEQDRDEQDRDEQDRDEQDRDEQDRDEETLEDADLDPREYDTLMELERLESLEEEMQEVGVTTLEEVREKIAELHRRLDEEEG